MNNDPAPDDKVPKDKPSRSQEFLRTVEEYANDLRQIIRKLRKKLD